MLKSKKLSNGNFEFTITCSKCNKSDEYDLESFNQFLECIEIDGWKNIKVDHKTWEHYCVDCYRNKQEDK